MKLGVVEWLGEIYFILDRGLDPYNDPPEVVHLLKLEDNLFKTAISTKVYIVPLVEICEITSKKRVLTIVTLF